MMNMIKGERGMTLIEVLVAFAIASIMILGIFEVFVAQKNLYISTDISANAQDNLRIAMDALTRDVMHAGFGVDPSLSFLFLNVNTGLPAADFDSTTGPDTLQFLARERNPLPGANENGCPANTTDISKRFYWSITGANQATGLTIHVCEGFELYRGTILLAMCSDGMTYAYFRYTGAKLTRNAESDVTIPSAQLNIIGSVTSGNYPIAFLSNNIDVSCYSSGAQLYRVNYYRYYIRPPEVDAVTGREVVPPYLMLDTGLDLNDDNNIDENDHIPVAEGIEDMQVVYNFLNGNCAGSPACLYNRVSDMANYADVMRPVFCDDPNFFEETCIAGSVSARNDNNPGDDFDDRPGNTVSVRVSLVARTAIPEPIQGSSSTEGPGGFTPLDVENHIIPSPKPVDRFKRLLFQMTIPVRNTLSKSQFTFIN